MTIGTYLLGRPRPAASRGGDCRARDLDQARNVEGPHRFAATTHCQISNGMLRLTVGAAGAAPSLTVEAWRGRVTVGDYLSDILSDTLPGSLSTPEWIAMGVITIDSPSAAALLSAVRLVRISPEAVTIRLIAPLIADAYVTLRRGERQCSIQHGNTRDTRVDTDRRIRWTGSPPPVGTAFIGRVEELAPAIDGFLRFVAALDAANAEGFGLVSTSATARFGAGVGTYGALDRPYDMHKQMGDASLPRLVVT